MLTRLPFFHEAGLLPLRKKYVWFVLICLVVLLVVCIRLILNNEVLITWNLLLILGIAMFEIGFFYAWIAAGVYMREAWAEEDTQGDKTKSVRYRDLMLDCGMRAMVALTVAIGLFTLAMLFRLS